MRLMLAAAGAMCAAAISVAAHAATVISFSDFSSCAGLQINGNAACTGGVLRLTPSAPGQSGSTFSTSSIQLGAGAAFSTFFTFRMSNVGGIGDGDGTGADGIVFVVQPVASTVGGGGGGIGYDGIPTSVGVEFDTFNNGIGFNDLNGNHVGIDLNGSVVSVLTAPIGTRLNDGNVWYAWVDYDGAVLELRLSQQAARPDTATLSYTVDLAAVLGTTQAFVGFTAGTGAGYEDQDILSWQFNSGFDPIGVIGPFSVPALSPGLLAAAGLLLALFGAAAFRRRARES
jgi:hypothetical protein